MPNRFRKGKSGKAHKSDFPGYKENNGKYGTILLEPVPEFFKRPGDGIITAELDNGVDNNAAIIFGRDRTGMFEIDNINSEVKNSIGVGSYAEFMGAGSIDIVAGRCAPFPLQGDFTVGPLYNTEVGINALLGKRLTIEEPSQEEVYHPGYAMDAARIYISQMTNIDKNFKIETTLTDLDKLLEQDSQPNDRLPPPSSGIMLKADKVRMHARNDIKIVTGGPHENIDSQGEPIIDKTSGIHLVAQNLNGRQQPIPLGTNLENCLNDIIDNLNVITTIVKRFATEQMSYNNVLSNHYHNSPFYGVATSPSITAGPEGVKTSVNEFRYVVAQCAKVQSNLQFVKNEFLTPGAISTDPDNYINSRFNTTN